jgi:hypothetical protein
MFVFWVLRATASVAAPIATTQPDIGPIRCWDEIRQNPPLHLHFVSIDLRDPSIAIRLFPSGKNPAQNGHWQTTLATVSDVAEREHLEVGVNANLFTPKDHISIIGRSTPYFTGNWACLDGWAMSDGKLWADGPAIASLIVDSTGRVRIGRYEKIPSDARQIVSGSALLVDEGHNVAPAAEAAPRTAAGVDRGGQTLTLLVIDGRRPSYSAGETLIQLADEMIHLGCSDALNLDGGGSATLAVRDPSTGKVKVANRPSDGHDLLIPLSLERPVADVLGVMRSARSASGPASTE